MTPLETIVLFIILTAVFYYFYILFVNKKHAEEYMEEESVVEEPFVSVPFAGGSESFAGGSESFAGGSESFAGGSESFAGGSESFGLQEGLGITSVSPANSSLQLGQYMMMGAYNATYDGSQHTIDQLTKVLTAGCRFLDLEIRFQDVSPVIMVSQTLSKVSATSLPLKDVLTTIINTSFGQNSINRLDPLFMHFRIIIDSGNTNSRSSLYNALASILESGLGPRLYSGNVDSKTSFQNIVGNIVLVADMSLIPDVASYPQVSCKPGSRCKSLSSLLNSATGTALWSKMQYNNVSGMALKVNADNTVSNPLGTTPGLELVVPPQTTIPGTTFNNPSPVDLNRFVVLSGVQTVLYMWYQKDTGNNEIQFYNSLFSNAAATFVPLAEAIPWIQENYMKQAGAQTANYTPPPSS